MEWFEFTFIAFKVVKLHTQLSRLTPVLHSFFLSVGDMSSGKLIRARQIHVIFTYWRASRIAV